MWCFESWQITPVSGWSVIYFAPRYSRDVADASLQAVKQLFFILELNGASYISRSDLSQSHRHRCEGWVTSSSNPIVDIPLMIVIARDTLTGSSIRMSNGSPPTRHQKCFIHMKPWCWNPSRDLRSRALDDWHMLARENNHGRQVVHLSAFEVVYWVVSTLQTRRKCNIE